MSLTEYQQAASDEWTRYVAAHPILIDGVRAFNPGDAVPASHVARGVVAAEDVVQAGEYEPATQRAVRILPPGADSQPDPADVEAAARANREAGVE